MHAEGLPLVWLGNLVRHFRGHKETIFSLLPHDKSPDFFVMRPQEVAAVNGVQGDALAGAAFDIPRAEFLLA